MARRRPPPGPLALAFIGRLEPGTATDEMETLSAEYSMRITVGYGDPARGQVRKLLRFALHGPPAMFYQLCMMNS